MTVLLPLRALTVGVSVVLLGSLTSPVANGVTAEAAGTATIASGRLDVVVSTAFPQVVEYRRGSEVLHGRSEPLTEVVLNGTPYTAEVDSTVRGDRVDYTLTFPGAEGTELDASLSVTGNVVTFAVDAVRDSDAFRVHTIEVPDHDLVSVRSSDPQAQVAAARVDLSINRNGDTVYPVTADTPADDEPIGSTYTLVSTGELAAGLETNSVYDTVTPATTDDNAHFWRQARETADHTEVAVWSGQWTYRAEGASDTEPLPEVRIAVSAERNGDGVVDWQDAAIGLRKVMYVPRGAAKTSKRVVQRIPFNIASSATHPFLTTLDDTKRIALATDGLGQLVILKGYQSEGHDAAHPDYGGHYNTRAGGLADLNTLLAEGAEWNADFGVHVNATESYPEAHAFSETLVDKDDPQWAWMDQSYRIKQRRDLTSGDVIRRFQRLTDETHGRLDFLYIDVFRESGWLADRLARGLRRMEYGITTEWSHRFVRDALWTHWSADFDYGGADFKGINSTILRFLGNHQRDVFIPNDLLGSAQIVEFEGWTGEVDYNAFRHNVFANNLPVKFLQRAPIVSWSEHEIRLANGVRVTDAAGTRQVFTGDGSLVLDGDAYLLPWHGRLYHYREDGGSSSWDLPAPYADAERLWLYRLTDQGRRLVGQVPVADGRVSLEAAGRTAYVLYPREAPAEPNPHWGEGTPIDDPGFNAGDLRHWNVTGDASVQRNDRGQLEAVLAPGGPARIGQRLTGLAPGTYAASAMVEIEPDHRRRTTIRVRPESGRPAATWLDRSTVLNTVASSEKHSTHAQRVQVFFRVPRGADAAVLAIRTGAGDGWMRLDDVRVVPATPPERSGAVTSWDFEDVDQGWGPFYRGGNANLSDATTHLAERHAPYTQRGWNGKVIDDVLRGDWSLKSFEYAAQTAYRTAPETVRFRPGHRYRVSFDYESEKGGQYAWVRGVDGPTGTRVVSSTPLPKRVRPTTHTQRFVAGDCGDYWVGLRRLATDENQYEFALDDLTVEDLGPAESSDACGEVAISVERDAVTADPAAGR